MNKTLFKIIFSNKFQSKINWSLLVFISSLMLNISCSKSDDLETIINEPPVENESIIIYTDIEPDFTSENLNDSYDLDLNNDGIVDFNLSSIELFPQEYIYINSKFGNASISVTPWYSYSVPLDSGKEISSRENYERGSIFAIGECYHDEGGGCFYAFYDWKDKYDKYLGLTFFKDGKTFYGWARLDVTSATQWVIKDYAFNATPNKSILAGQKE